MIVIEKLERKDDNTLIGHIAILTACCRKKAQVLITISNGAISSIVRLDDFTALNDYDTARLRTVIENKLKYDKPTG